MKKYILFTQFAWSLTGAKICDYSLVKMHRGERCWYWPFPHLLPPHRAIGIAYDLYLA